MSLTLLLSALLMGFAGVAHCFAMCGVPAAAVMKACGGARPTAAMFGFYLGRTAGYAAAGAAAAASVSALAMLGQYAPVFKPLWAMTHMAAFVLGMWMLIKGRQPEWLERIGLGGSRQPSAVFNQKPSASQWRPVVWGGAKATLAGAAWFAWPCGLLQSALVVAALGSTPLSGAAVMVVFSLASAAGLIIGPALTRWLVNRRNWTVNLTQSAVRLSGAALAGASIWALSHDVLAQVVAYCFS